MGGCREDRAAVVLQNFSATRPENLSIAVIADPAGHYSRPDVTRLLLPFHVPPGFDLAGKLTLTFSTTSFGDDSSIQFSTGGRTVAFTIPAGSTR